MTEQFSARHPVVPYRPMVALGLGLLLAIGAASVELRSAPERGPQVEPPPVRLSASRLRVGDLERLRWVFSGAGVDEETLIALGSRMNDWISNLPPDEARRIMEQWDDDPWTGTMFSISAPGESPIRAVRMSLDRRLPGPDEWPTVLNVSEVTEAVRRLYPDTKDGKRMEGTVGMQWLVDERGSIVRTRVVQASRYPELDRVALEVAALYRFAPAVHNGQAVAAWATGPVSFRLVE